MLTENPWNGGCGYTPLEVGQMSMDQIWSRLCDIDILKNSSGNHTLTVTPQAVPGILSSDEDGLIAGRASDGTPIKGRIRGKSVARELMEREAARKQKEERRKRRRQRK